MHAIVVYESHWGSTKAVAHAIAEGIGKDAQALTTDEATPEVVGEADLIVAGAPVIAFALPRASATAQLAADTKAPRPADVSHPLLRAWLERLPAGRRRFAAFETRIWWSPRGATGTIEARLSRAGYQRIAKAERFVVAGAYGPLREGELERARDWGAKLFDALRTNAAASAA
jgi:flavorubredoxin